MYVRMAITDDCEEFLASPKVTILDEHTDECDSMETRYCPDLTQPVVTFWDWDFKGRTYPRFETFKSLKEAEEFADCLVEPLLAHYVPNYNLGQQGKWTVPYRDRFTDLPEHGGPSMRVFVVRVDVHE